MALRDMHMTYYVIPPRHWPEYDHEADEWTPDQIREHAKACIDHCMFIHFTAPTTAVWWVQERPGIGIFTIYVFGAKVGYLDEDNMKKLRANLEKFEDER